MDSLASPEDGWLIPPYYDSIYPNEDGSYLFARSYSNMARNSLPNVERTLVFNLIKGEIAFKGDYQTIQFAGYQNADITAGTSKSVASDDIIGTVVTLDDINGIFYVETSTRKGYINDQGEWLVSLSRFDTLDADG